MVLKARCTQIEGTGVLASSAAAGTSASGPATSTRASAPTPGSTTGSIFLLCFRLGCVVDQQRLERETVRQNVVSNVVTAYAQRLQLDGIAVLYGHFHCFQVCIHGHVDSSDCSVHLGAVFQFNCHSFVTEFHQKPEIGGKRSVRGYVDMGKLMAGLLRRRCPHDKEALYRLLHTLLVSLWSSIYVYNILSSKPNREYDTVAFLTKQTIAGDSCRRWHYHTFRFQIFAGWNCGELFRNRKNWGRSYVLSVERKARKIVLQSKSQRIIY